MSKISRREFLKGAVAGSAVLVTGSLLGACTGDQETKETPAANGSSAAESTPAETQAPETNAPETAAPETAGTPAVAETYEAEVVIVGAGAAGLQAALNLARDGKDVIVVEKGMSAVVSNFALCGGPTACETKLQEDNGTPVSLDTIYNHMYQFSNGSVNGKLLRKVLSCTGKAIDDMSELGIPMIVKEDTYGVGFQGRHMIMTDGEGRVTPLVNEIEANGGRFIYSCAVNEIIMENGAAAGVRGQGENGVIEVHAKAVVVCTGGFLGGEEMQQEHFNTKVFALGNTLSDGAGIRMVQAAGGVLDRNFAVLGNECGAVSKAQKTWPFTPEWFNVNEHYGYWLFGGLYVDKTGERFVNEGDVATFPLAKGGEAILRAGKAYVVMDSAYYNGIRDQGIYATLGEPKEWEAGRAADYYKTTPENAEAHLQQAIDEGWGIKADTIEEIAETFGLADLPETVASYNTYCEEGYDPEFYKPACFLTPVKEAPFYAFEYVPSAWGTNGGVKVDSHLRAVDQNNDYIPGLYVAGVDTGSMYTAPYYDNEGSSVGLAIGSGVLVAREVEAIL